MSGGRRDATTGAPRGWPFRHDGVATLWLEVRASNEIARKAYVRLGFAEVGVRRHYYPAPADGREDAIVMSLRLDEATGFDALE